MCGNPLAFTDGQQCFLRRRDLLLLLLQLLLLLLLWQSSFLSYDTVALMRDGMIIVVTSPQ